MGVGSLSEGYIHCRSWEDGKKDSGTLKTLRHVTSFCGGGGGVGDVGVGNQHSNAEV